MNFLLILKAAVAIPLSGVHSSNTINTLVGISKFFSPFLMPTKMDLTN